MNDPRPTSYCARCDTDTERYANGSCAPCRRAQRRGSYHRNLEQQREVNRQSARRNAEASRERYDRWVASNAEWRAAYMRDYRKKHREQARERERRWNQENPEGRAEANRRWREQNPEKHRANQRTQSARRRARKRGAVTDDHTPAEVFERDGGICQLRLHPDCRRDLDPARSREWQIDHIVPLSRGGTHTRDNVQLACDRCNARKGARTPEEIEAAHRSD